MNWIKASEQMPEKNGEPFVALTKHGERIILTWDPDFEHFSEPDDIIKVPFESWWPIPPIPKTN